MRNLLTHKHQILPKHIVVRDQLLVNLISITLHSLLILRSLKGTTTPNKTGEYSAYLCCSAEKNWVIPGGAKPLNVLTARLQMRAAYIATLLEVPSISGVSVLN
jgi:hypothetical protein